MRTDPERGSWRRAACIGLVVVLSACREDAQRGDGVVLAQFDDHALTVEEFQSRLAAMPPEMRAEYAAPAARERLLNDMVRLELLADEAKRRGVDRSPQVKVRVSELVVEEMMNGLFGSESAEAAKVTDDEIRRYYDAHAAEFRSPAGVRPLDDVRTLIRARLAQEKRREAVARFVEDVRARAQPRVHPERLPAAPSPGGSAGTGP